MGDGISRGSIRGVQGQHAEQTPPGGQAPSVRGHGCSAAPTWSEVVAPIVSATAYDISAMLLGQLRARPLSHRWR
jgi:hypothetical protein